MRKEKALRNIASNVLLQFAVVAQRLVVSRFILSTYGSAVNGMVNSISQFLVYAGLLEMGIGNASIVALYKPVSENNWTEINIIVSTVKRKYYLSGILYALILCGLAILYPLVIGGQLSYGFVSSMVIVLGELTLVDYTMLAGYKIFLSALQKHYVLNIARSISTISAMVVDIILIVNGYSLIIVKGIIVLIYICEALFIRHYVMIRYPKLRGDLKQSISLEQQNNSLIHQFSNMVIYNTDLVVLTLCLSGDALCEVSVYTVYAMTYNAIINVINILISGIDSTFGDIISRKEEEKLKKWYDFYEYAFLIITFSIYTCFIVLILPFIRCYTVGINDTNYVRLSVGILFCFSGLSAHIKAPAMVLITAAGHFRQTQKYVLLEAVLNIAISLILVKDYGINGVLAGTIISHVTANVGYIRYTDKVILKRNANTTRIRIIRNSLIFAFLSVTEFDLAINGTGWGDWILNGLIAVIINFGVYILINMILEPEKRIYLKNAYVKLLKEKQHKYGKR